MVAGGVFEDGEGSPVHPILYQPLIVLAVGGGASPTDYRRVLLIRVTLARNHGGKLCLSIDSADCTRAVKIESKRRFLHIFDQ